MVNILPLKSDHLLETEMLDKLVMSSDILKYIWIDLHIWFN